MTLQRMDHVGIVVDDLAAATEFFLELGLELQGEGSVQGRAVDRINGLEGVRADIAMMQTPDGTRALELVKYHSPPTHGGDRHAPANTPGIRHITFAVEDIHGVVAGLQAHGAELVGELENYENSYRLCYIRGGDGDDQLFGTSTYDELKGGQGNDQLRAGRGGADQLLGGPGNEQLFGGDGDPVYLDGGGGQDQLYGGRSDETLTDGDQDGAPADMAPGPDTLDGGGGSDTLSYDGRKQPVTVRIGADPGGNAGEAGEHDTVSDIESVTGGAAEDLLVGDQRANVLDGGGGDDILDGQGGGDVLLGGAGFDALGCGGGVDPVERPQVRELLSRECEQGRFWWDCHRLDCGSRSGSVCNRGAPSDERSSSASSALTSTTGRTSAVTAPSLCGRPPDATACWAAAAFATTIPATSSHLAPR